MATQVQSRRGTTAEHAAFTGANGELTVDTDKDVLVVHDGTTAGGHPMLKQDGSNSALALGSASSPSLKFTGDTNTGIYSPGADQVAISTNGSNRLQIDSSGNVGIGAAPVVTFAGQTHLTVNHSAGGTSVAGYNLAVNGTRYASFISYPSNSEALRITAESATLPITFHTNSSERMRLDSSGRLGLGTSSPSYALDVNGVARISSYLITPLVDVATNTGIYSQVANTLQLQTNNVERMRIDSSGRVGIGTTSPGSFNGDLNTLVVGSGSGNQGMTIFAGTASTSNISFHDTANTSLSGMIRYDHSNDAMSFWTNGVNERARIDSSGRLLVGTSTSPTQPQGQYAILVAQGYAGVPTAEGIVSIQRGQGAASITSGADIGRLVFGDSAGNTFAGMYCYADANAGSGDYPGRLSFSTTADGASSPTERMRLSSTGKLNVFDSSGAGLRVNSAVGSSSTDNVFTGFYGASSTTAEGTASIAIRTNGDVRNTNNSYGALSDVKLKENIADANSQWDDLKAVRVRNFNFKEGQTHRQIGVIAQELELVSPGLVSESPDFDADGNDIGTVTKSVNYSVLYMKAVKALQEAMERIETLEAKVAALEVA